LLAIGVAGSGKSVVLNEVAKVLNCIFFQDGEILMCAATGLLAEYFNPSASTVNSAIGAYPPAYGGEQNWNQSVEQWKNWIQGHGKITNNLKVLINTEVYAQSSNMLQALLEIRRDKEQKFICLLDGDP
jgi:cytidylate kinase